MKTLEDAWQWFNDAKQTMNRMLRVGNRYWDAIPWDQQPWRSDNRFGTLTAEDITKPAENALENLDDLAIVVLFSVFESRVRNAILQEIDGEGPKILHPILSKAFAYARAEVEQGSFFTVLESYKPQDAELIEEVNQVRRYRNWVAHGKRGVEPASVDPQAAYDRLARFLLACFPLGADVEKV